MSVKHTSPRWRLLGQKEANAAKARESKLASSGYVHTAQWYCQHCCDKPTSTLLGSATPTNIGDDTRAGWTYDGVIKHVIDAYVPRASHLAYYRSDFPGIIDTKSPNRLIGTITFIFPRTNGCRLGLPLSWSTTKSLQGPDLDDIYIRSSRLVAFICVHVSPSCFVRNLPL